MTELRGRRRGRSVRLRAACACLVMTFALTACWGGDNATAPEPVAQSLADLRYLSPDGNNDGPGTKAQPWRTFNYALPLLRAGQTLYVRGGTYREQLTQVKIKDGTESRRIVVQAYPGERPVIQGVLWLWRPAYWTIDGVNVTWDPTVKVPPAQMVKVTGGKSWIWQNSEIWGARTAVNMFVTGWKTREPVDWSVTGNCIHSFDPPRDVKQGSNLTLGDMRPSNGDVSRNLIFQGPGGRNIVLGSAWRHGSGGPDDVVIRYNTVYGAGVAITLAGDTTDVLIERNLLGSASTGTLIRGNLLKGTGNVVQHNLGMEAARLLPVRPHKSVPAKKHLRYGAGNLLTNDVRFSNVTRCDGFRSTQAVALPYGRDGLG